MHLKQLRYKVMAKFKVRDKVRIVTFGFSPWDECQAIIKDVYLKGLDTVWYQIDVIYPHETYPYGKQLVVRDFCELDLELVKAYEDPLETQEFYELMQSYRHCPGENQTATIQYFNQVKQFIRDNKDSI